MPREVNATGVAVVGTRAPAAADARKPADGKGGGGKKAAGASASQPLSREAQRLARFDKLLGADIEVVDLAKLREASWSGIPPKYRAVGWQLLLGYLPSNVEYRADALQRKRREYWESVPQYFDVSDAERSQYQRETLHQILMDVPRTCAAPAQKTHDLSADASACSTAHASAPPPLAPFPLTLRRAPRAAARPRRASSRPRRWGARSSASCTSGRSATRRRATFR